MSYPDPLSRWRETVSAAFPHLSRPQAMVLQLGCSEANLVQRLREWCYGAKDKQGTKRQELEVSTCFGPL